MPAFIIEGGHRLSGDITPQGAKNEALQVLCATLLTDEPVRIQNLPDIADVNNQIRLLQDIGVRVEHHAKGDCTFQADHVDTRFLESDTFRQCCSSLRGSVMMVGPLLARFGRASV
ncbi:MAG: UDP-N-acetylglucosamine 1-carboxyvinyltransferase, partial [Bacteroidaceae bacterium]|nr:UDP-N-acetylglucosamine 1-carboxyvinyltransferase [Bacteroidaceae bacterium]